MKTKKDLVGKFVTVAGFGEVPFYVDYEIGENRFAMVNSNTRQSHCIDTDCHKVTEWIRPINKK